MRRVFRKGFARKVARTSVLKHYGLKTLMYGVLLPGPGLTDPAALARCHARLCTLPPDARHGPGHDTAACHHAMTSGIGVLTEDSGYHSEANLAAPGPPRLIADGKTRDLAGRQPAAGPPPAGATPAEANAWRLRTPEGRAAYKRRAPDVEGLHASLKDRGGLRRFSLRGLHNATSEFLFAGLAHNLRLLAAID